MDSYFQISKKAERRKYEVWRERRGKGVRGQTHVLGRNERLCCEEGTNEKKEQEWSGGHNLNVLLKSPFLEHLLPLNNQ